MAKRILIQFAHPALQKSRVNRKLIAALQSLEDVTINDLYEEYPDFSVNVKREQELLLSHDIIVFQHPFYWYSCPALLKEWEDLVLQYGFAYGAQGTQLNGKWVLTAITTGGPKSAYQRDGNNYFTIRELLSALRTDCPTVRDGLSASLRDERDIGHEKRGGGGGAAALYRRAVENLRDGRFDLAEFEELSYLNEILEPSASIA